VIGCCSDYEPTTSCFSNELTTLRRFVSINLRVLLVLYVTVVAMTITNKKYLDCDQSKSNVSE